jgi:hypothetical protein
MNELSEEIIQQVLNSEWLKERDESMKSIGWNYRNSNIGTYYEIGWDERDDEGNDVWFCDHKTTSLSNAHSTASRWGCDYKEIRSNPYKTKEAN